MKKTLFLPGLYGQYKVWQNGLALQCEEADRIIQLGNIIGTNDSVRDYEKAKDGRGNRITLDSTLLYRKMNDKQKEWIQLMGRNELVALNYPDKYTCKESLFKIYSMWFQQNPAISVAYDYNGILVTHGGLTYGLWNDLGRPNTAKEASSLLNEMFSQPHINFPHNGCSVGGIPDYSANPIFCEPALELYPSWIHSGEELPFAQIHGYESLNNEKNRVITREKSSFLYYADYVRFTRWGSIVKIKNNFIYGIDLDLNRELIDSLDGYRKIYYDLKK